MRWFVDCANCGKQVSIDGPASKCYWCGKNATKIEEVAPSETVELSKDEAKVMVTEEEKAKFRATNVRGKTKWLEKHMAEIVADIRSLSRKEILKKWPFKASVLLKITKLHAPEMVGHTRTGKEKKEESATSEDTSSLTEHERYLMLLGYQMAVREFLAADKSHAYGD